MCLDPDLDLLNLEVEMAYQRFVERGGLDSTAPTLDEDYERFMRQSVYCPCGLLPQRCKTHRKEIPAYGGWPG